MEKPFEIERTFPVPASRLWTTLTNPDEMKNWYFDLPGFKAETGYEFSFVGGSPDGVQYTHLCRVTEAEPLKKLTYSWRYEGYEGNSFVTFELFPEGNSTRLRLTHAGLETFPVHPDFARANFEAGWTDIIGRSLAEYLQK